MDQLRKIFARLSLIQRISVAVAALLAAAGILAVTHYRNESDFHPLYTAMAAEDAAPVVQKLKESGVEYRLSDNGSTVLVRTEKLAESRLTLAGAGLPKSGRIGFELFDKTSFGATELVEHINYQRALEGELERSVMSMAEVVQARVHLTLSKESVFLDQQQPAKASVMVKLRPGAQISQQNVLAVTHLVASAVDGLNADAVAVLDMDGNLLNRPRQAGNNDAQVTSESLEVRHQIERDLVSKISSTLEPLLGPTKFRAGASVDCDLTSGDQQEETFDPEKSVMVSSQKTEDGSERTAKAGVPGTAANLDHPPAANGATGSSTSYRTENVTYQSSRVIRHTRIPQGVIKRMSLSVLIGQDVHWEGEGKTRHRVTTPPAPETLQKIRDLVAGVTGFTTDRGDQLIVETLPFESALIADNAKPATPGTKAPPEPAWLQFFNKYRIPVLAGFAVVVLAGVVFALKRKKARPGVSQVDVTAQLNAASAAHQDARALEAGAADSTQLSDEAQALLGESQEELTERIRQIATRDLVATANVLRSWLQDQKA